jgi:hypothetical protein
MQVVQPGAGIGALGQALTDDDLLAPPQQRDQVVQRVFPVILLAAGQGGGGGGAVGDDGPLDAVDIGRAPAGDAVGLAGGGAITVEPGPDGAAAGVPFVPDEAERA